MQDFYKPLAERTPDTQYRDRIEYILRNGRMLPSPQGNALTCFGTLPDMVFDLSNGAPVITERDMLPFWQKPIAEISAFINGARTIDEIESYGCDFWEKYRGDGAKLGLDPDDMGPGSYGPAFHDYPKPDGTTLNQYQQTIEQIAEFPEIRTHRITPWIPFYTARGDNRKVIVAPCHGDQFFRVMDGELHLTMVQRSGDMPVGVPSNMVQYTAVLLMLCHELELRPGTFVHKVIDAHIYEIQIEKMEELIKRPARPFPRLRLREDAPEFFKIRTEHFVLDEYEPHPFMKVPWIP